MKISMTNRESIIMTSIWTLVSIPTSIYIIDKMSNSGFLIFTLLALMLTVGIFIIVNRNKMLHDVEVALLWFGLSINGMLMVSFIATVALNVAGNSLDKILYATCVFSIAVAVAIMYKRWHGMHGFALLIFYVIGSSFLYALIVPAVKWIATPSSLQITVESLSGIIGVSSVLFLGMIMVYDRIDSSKGYITAIYLGVVIAHSLIFAGILPKENYFIETNIFSRLAKIITVGVFVPAVGAIINAWIVRRRYDLVSKKNIVLAMVFGIGCFVLFVTYQLTMYELMGWVAILFPLIFLAIGSVLILRSKGLLALVIDNIRNMFPRRESGIMRDNVFDRIPRIQLNNPEDQFDVPADAVVMMDMPNGTVSMSGDQLNQLRSSFQQSMGDTIVKHLGMLKGMLGPSGKRHIDEISTLREDIVIAICNKMPLCLKDEKGHSIGLETPDRKTLVSVSCWPCALHELRGRFEAQLGPYVHALEGYLQNTLASGHSTFVHIFFCYVSMESFGVTVTYISQEHKAFIRPNELITEEEILGLGN